MWRVPVFRQQSRVFTVEGEDGKKRPFFVGQWTDNQGIKHTKGMADLLAMPRVEFYDDGKYICDITVPLWIECKAGTGTLTKDQREFKDFIEESGAFYICAVDSSTAVLDWFRDEKVKKP